MSATQMVSELDRIVTGIEVQQAVDLTVSYILRTENFETREKAYSYWVKLTEDEKVDVLVKALRQR